MLLLPMVSQTFNYGAGELQLTITYAGDAGNAFVQGFAGKAEQW